MIIDDNAGKVHSVCRLLANEESLVNLNYCPIWFRFQCEVKNHPILENHSPLSLLLKSIFLTTLF